MEEYLPPIVTKLKGDISDLVAAFAEARALARDFAAGSHKDIVDAMGDAGRDGGAIFGNEFRKSSTAMLRDLERDVGATVRNESRRVMDRAGKDAGESFISSFFGLLTSHPLMLLIVAAIAAAAPVIGGLLATAFDLAFIGLGAYLLHKQAPLIAAFNDLKTTVGNIFKDIAMPMLGPLIQALGILKNLVIELGPSFKEIFASVAQTIVPVAQGIAAFFREMMPGLKEMLSHTEIVKAFAQGLGGLGSGLGEMFHQIAVHGPEIARVMTDFMIALANVVRWLGYFIVYMAVAWDSIHKGGVAVGKWISEAVHWVGDAVMAIGDWVSRAVAWFEALPGRIGAGMAALPHILAAIAQHAFDSFFYTVGFLVGSTVEFFRRLPDRIGEALKSLWEVAVGWAHRIADGFIAWWNSIPAQINKLQELPGKIKGWFTDAGKWLLQAGKDLLTGLINGLGDALDWAIGEAKRAGEKIAKGFKDALGIKSPSTVFAEYGKFSMQGFIQGVLGERTNLANLWNRMPIPGVTIRPMVALAGAAASTGYNANAYSGPSMVSTKISIDGHEVIDALTPAAQQRKARTGQTGLS